MFDYFSIDIVIFFVILFEMNIKIKESLISRLLLFKEKAFKIVYKWPK
jgi:hypothetical protein